jgi:hypothetical protein
MFPEQGLVTHLQEFFIAAFANAEMTMDELETI